MSDLAGYISSFLVSFGLASGFIIGGVIFAFLISYGMTLFFKRFRRLMSEDKPHAYSAGRARFIPLRTLPKNK